MHIQSNIFLHPIYMSSYYGHKRDAGSRLMKRMSFFMEYVLIAKHLCIYEKYSFCRLISWTERWLVLLTLAVVRSGTTTSVLIPGDICATVAYIDHTMVVFNVLMSNWVIYHGPFLCKTQMNNIANMASHSMSVN